MKRRTFALGALPAALILPGCGAGAMAAAWIPAVLAALSTAGALLKQVEHWVDRFRAAPGIPPSVFHDVDRLLADARAALNKTAELAGKGAEFQAAAEDAWQQARKVIDDLMTILATVGLYSQKAQALTAPASTARLRADGTSEPVESMVVELPPARLRQ
jgi:hypothetical protein